MQKYILIIGGGDLPVEIVKSFKKKQITFFSIIFPGNTVSKIVLKNNHSLINFGKVITELKKLKKLGFKNVLMIGKLKRPDLKDIKPDINSIKLIPKLTKIFFEGGDNNLLSFCINTLQSMNFKVIDIRKLIPENFLGLGNQTRIKLSNVNYNDITKGKLILDSISKFDIGQSIVVQNGNIICIEAAQGTDKLIKSSYQYISKDEKAILVKLAKIKQNLKADLPTIGLKTVINCKKNCIKGIAYSANKTLFLEKNKIIDFCNQNKIFLIGI